MKKYYNKHPDTVFISKDGWHGGRSSVRIKSYKKYGYTHVLEVNQQKAEKCLCCGVYAQSNIHVKDRNTKLAISCNCTTFSCDCETCTKLIFSDLFTPEQLSLHHWERLIEIVYTQFIDWAYYAQNTYNYKHKIKNLKRKDKIKYTFSEKVW